jgi:hypothetical protein
VRCTKTARETSCLPESALEGEDRWRSAGVYNLGTFLRDGLTVIAHNRASDGNDDCFLC